MKYSKTLRFLRPASLLLGLLLVGTAGMGQTKPALQRIQNAKIGLITNRLNLTTEQSQQFWPLYNEYEAKKMDVRLAIRKLNAETNNLTASDDNILADLRDMMSLRQKEVDLDKEYMNRFLKVVNVRQLAELYKTEQQFNRLLLEKLNRQQTASKL
jgi:Spy/CpxP family protein refolding chaperone